MALYVLPGAQDLSSDKGRFPLLYDGSSAVHIHLNVRYPLTIRFSDNTVHPVMKGGLITEQEVEQIAEATAQYIVDNHAGETVLLIEILEGALSFSRRVVSSIEKLDPQLHYSLTPIKIRSYEYGSRAGRHRIDQPLIDERHQEIRTLNNFDTVIVLDDLIDSGGTFAWLVREYLPDLSPEKIEACFMLEKVRPRHPEVEEVLAGIVLIGVQVPDFWVVGYGPDITLPGTAELAPLHLCRGELPGGVYAFNSEIEQQLITAYHADPTVIIDQLRSYITER
jgi:hypoxanthine-guanine phosphoribosyltransferase